jgi:gluconate 5-dehydrogenase
MNLNIDAAFLFAREFVKRAMIRRKAGKIVNMASTAALGGNPPEWELAMAAYNTSKDALITRTKALAAEWGRHNINVSAICPGFFLSRMTAVTLDRIETMLLRMAPHNRLGGTADFKGSLVFLAFEASRHIAGQALAGDGGYTAI